MAARKPKVGARLLASAPAWFKGNAPSSKSNPDAGTANTASGHPLGRVTANRSVATRRRAASVSAIGLDTILEIVSPKGLASTRDAYNSKEVERIVVHNSLPGQERHLKLSWRQVPRSRWPRTELEPAGRPPGWSHP